MKKVKRTLIYGKTAIPNAGIAAWYKRELTKLATAMILKCEKKILSVYNKLSSATDSAVFTFDDSLSSRERIEINKLSKEFEEVFKAKSSELAKRLMNKESNYANTTLHNSFGTERFDTAVNNFLLSKPAVSPELADKFKAAVTENVNLIRSIKSRYFEQITGAVSRSITDGTGIKYLTEELKKYKRMTNRRALLIARDQTHKAYNFLTFEKMKGIGINKWQWIHGGGVKEPRHYHKLDVSRGGLNHSIHKAGEKAYDPTKGVERAILPGELPYCNCLYKPVIEIGA